MLCSYWSNLAIANLYCVSIGLIKQLLIYAVFLLVKLPVERHHVAEHVGGRIMVPVLPPVKLQLFVSSQLLKSHCIIDSFPLIVKLKIRIMVPVLSPIKL